MKQVSLRDCEYDKKKKVLRLASEFFGMPSTFAVQSHFTGKVVQFRVVDENDPLFDHDHWDGEMQVYRPTEQIVGIDHAVIYNQW